MAMPDQDFNLDTAEYIRQAAQALAKVCDFAEEKDNQGFSKADAPFGHAIAEIPVSQWDHDLLVSTSGVLRKYRGQLEGMDFDINRVSAYAPSPKSNSGKGGSEGRSQTASKKRNTQFVGLNEDGDFVVRVNKTAFDKASRVGYTNPVGTPSFRRDELDLFWYVKSDSASTHLMAALLNAGVHFSEDAHEKLNKLSSEIVWPRNVDIVDMDFVQIDVSASDPTANDLQEMLEGISVSGKSKERVILTTHPTPELNAFFATHEYEIDQRVKSLCLSPPPKTALETRDRVVRGPKGDTGDVRVFFDYNPELINFIKGLGTPARFERPMGYTNESSYWSVTPRPDLVEKMSSEGFRFYPEAVNAINNSSKPDIDPSKRIAELLEDNETFRLHFPYDPKVVEAVKGLPRKDRQFISKGNEKFWEAAFTPDLIEKVIEPFEFEYDQDRIETQLKSREKEQAEKEALQVLNLQASKSLESELAIAGLKKELYAFQKAGVEYAARNRQTFIGDDMGLGKTIEGIATVQFTNSYPTLVTSPATLKNKWRKEFNEWVDDVDVEILHSKTPRALTVEEAQKKVFIINYDILPYWEEELKKIGLEGFVYDESHKLKSEDANRTKAAKEITDPDKLVLMMSGTILKNRPKELISPLDIMGRLEKDFGGFSEFAFRYCGPENNGYGWNFNGVSNTIELNEMLRKHCFVRRTKKEALPWLPDKTRSIVPLNISNRAEYDEAEQDFIRWIKERAMPDKEYQESIANLPKEEQKAKLQEFRDQRSSQASNAEELARINYLRQLVAKGKMEEACLWIEDVIEEGEKLVVFAHHREIVKELADRFDAPYLIGGMADKAQEIVEGFESNPDAKVIFLNSDAGGEGHDLVSASNVAIFEFEWSPYTHEQCEDRLLRIGQENAVNAWYFKADNTIDDQFWDIINIKWETLRAVNDGIEEAVEMKVMSDLIQRLKEKEIYQDAVPQETQPVEAQDTEEMLPSRNPDEPLPSAPTEQGALDFGDIELCMDQQERIQKEASQEASSKMKQRLH